jgi:hypothetical protein
MRRTRSNSVVSTACSAAAADFSRSKLAMRSTNAASQASEDTMSNMCASIAEGADTTVNSS